MARRCAWFRRRAARRAAVARHRQLALLGLSLFGLTGGTLLLRRFCAEVPPFESTAVQLIGGALASVLLMLLFETPHWHWTAHFAAALAWNTLAMSIFGMAIYN